MASKTSKPIVVDRGTAGGKSYYVTEVTTLADGGVIRETYRSDDKGNKESRIQSVTIDGSGNITKDEVNTSTATIAEQRDLRNPNSQLRNGIKNQVNNAATKLADDNIDGTTKETIQKAASGSGNEAINDANEGGSQPSGEPSKPAPGVNEGIKGMDARYPEDIGGTKQDVIKFDMLEYRPSNFEDRPSVDSIDASKIIGSVFLAVPGGIQDQSIANWNSETMNPLQKAAAGIAGGAIDGNADESINKAMGQLQTQSPEIKTAIKGYFTGQATGIGQQALQRGAGVVLNPNMELLFNGPSVRQFTFNFLLAPRSESEQKQVVNIIRFFKQGMSPIKSEANLFLKSPNTFRLRYIHRESGEDSEHKFLTKFKECALTSTGVNYTPNTNYATFKDGGMVAYQLALTFQELEPVFNNDYAKVTDGIGY